MSMRRISVFTSTRADYGLLRPILSELERAQDIDLLLVVSGTHLASSHGRTVSEIEYDGMPIAARVASVLDDDTSVGSSYSMALTLQGVASALDHLRPDIFVVLGDRYEALSAAAAAMMARIPIAHLHGGESTQGAIDDAIRHSITKLSHLHLVAAEPFRRTVLQLGEAPERVHVVGAPGLDNIRTMPLMDRKELGESLDWNTDSPFLLVTYHPVTLRADRDADELNAVIEALRAPRTPRALITAPNADPGNNAIRSQFQSLSADNPDRFLFVRNLGQVRYLSAMNHAAAVVGNSSSGLIEAPFLGTPTVNIGERQGGRLRAPSVIDCAAATEDIVSAIHAAIDMEACASSLYGDGRTAERVTHLLRTTNLNGILIKRFHAIGPSGPEGSA